MSFLIGTRKGLFVIERAPERGWQIVRTAFEGDHVPIVTSDPRDGAIYAVLKLGHFGTKLHRSTDGGRTFTEIGVPVYPPRPADATDVDPVRKAPREWNLELIWSLEPGGASQPGRLWAGTVPGGLFRSDDRGATWELVRSLWDRPERSQWFGGGMDQPGIHSILVDPRDPRHVAVGVSCAGVWVTRDDGASWAQGGPGMRAEYMPPDQAFDPAVQDPHRIVACPAAPDVYWAQHHNGIFLSRDAAASWVEIETARPSRFGFAVAVHPRDPETAWFVPAIKDEKRIPVAGQLVVTRTRDGGRSFDLLSRGLPQSWAYDLVFRHALDVDATGQTLAFGSTTGNLWVSDDGGDSWATISHHLPPIYCVRHGVGAA